MIDIMERDSFRPTLYTKPSVRPERVPSFQGTRLRYLLVEYHCQHHSHDLSMSNE